MVREKTEDDTPAPDAERVTPGNALLISVSLGKESGSTVTTLATEARLRVNVSLLSGESGSPQSTSTVNVSSVPGSVIVPESVATPFSSIAATGSNTNVGATLVTSTVVPSLPDSPPSSVTVAWIG